MKKVKIYSQNNCSYCQAAKRFFDRENIEYEEINLDEDPNLRQDLSDKYHWRTVPMIFLGDEFIGGYMDLMALAKKTPIVSLLHE